MQIDFVARNYPVDDRLRDFTRDKLHKVTKFLDEPVDVRVTVENEKHRQIVDLHVAHRFGVIQARETTSADMYDAVNLAVDKAEKQARRAKKKFHDKRRRADRQNGQEWPLAVLDRDSVDSGAEPRIIKSSQLTIKPMSIEEAALRLTGSKNDFVVFRDSSSDRISVLYKRKDRNYGLISPET